MAWGGGVFIYQGWLAVGGCAVRKGRDARSGRVSGRTDGLTVTWLWVVSVVLVEGCRDRISGLFFLCGRAVLGMI
jgi:hypothetical protein